MSSALIFILVVITAFSEAFQTVCLTAVLLTSDWLEWFVCDDHSFVAFQHTQRPVGRVYVLSVRSYSVRRYHFV